MKLSKAVYRQNHRSLSLQTMPSYGESALQNLEMKQCPARLRSTTCKEERMINVGHPAVRRSSEPLLARIPGHFS